MKRLKSDSKGFTIIETLIVLGIAGLMLLIIFEALPALERSGRNNQRKQDVQTILEAVSHYELNNSANIPDCGYSGAVQASCIGTGSNQLGNPQLSYYPPTAVSVHYSVLGSLASSYTNPNTASNFDQVKVINHAVCKANSPGQASNRGASYSNIVALYAVEIANGFSIQCQAL